MRTPSGSKLRPQIQARPQTKEIDSLVAAGVLTRARRQGRSRSVRPGNPAPHAAAPHTALKAHVAPNTVEWFQVPGWEHLDWLWHGFSTRHGGVSRAYSTTASRGELNLGFTADDERDAVAQNRRLLAEAVTGNSAVPLVTVRQIHSNLVLRAGYSDAGPAQQPAKGDGLMTDQPGLLLAVMTADCIPVLVADRRRRVVAAFHAGWRGTVRRIVECGVGHLRFHFGSSPEDLIAAIGPGIGACCYAVGEEVQAAFESQFAYASDLFTEVYDPDPVRLKYPMLFLNQRAPGHAPPMMSLHLDLVEANRRQLIDAGLSPGSIFPAGACTRCHSDRFFSHRAEHGRTGRMMAVIGIRNPSIR
jgi:YfiH family protein